MLVYKHGNVHSKPANETAEHQHLWNDILTVAFLKLNFSSFELQKCYNLIHTHMSTATVIKFYIMKVKISKRIF